MAADFYIKTGDTRPLLEKQLLDRDGDPVNLTGAAVVFIMSQDGVLKVNRGSCSLVDAATGQAAYTWQAADTDTAGDYDGEFEVTFSPGVIQTFPNPRKLRIVVTDDLG